MGGAGDPTRGWRLQQQRAWEWRAGAANCATKKRVLKGERKTHCIARGMRFPERKSEANDFWERSVGGGEQRPGTSGCLPFWVARRERTRKIFGLLQLPPLCSVAAPYRALSLSYWCVIPSAHPPTSVFIGWFDCLDEQQGWLVLAASSCLENSRRRVSAPLMEKKYLFKLGAKLMVWSHPFSSFFFPLEKKSSDTFIFPSLINLLPLYSTYHPSIN